MTDAGILFAQTKDALIASSRNVRTVVFTIVFPASLLVLFNGIFSSHTNTHALGNTSIRIAAFFTTLGLAITAFTPTVDAASAIGPFSAVILSFISGVFIPIWQLPRWLQAIGKALPLQPLADGLQRCVALHGTGFNGSDITRLLVWGAVGLFVAVRRFKWEPQASGGA